MTKYYAIEPATFKLDGGAMYGIIPKPLWNKCSPADEQNRIDLALRLLLIDQGEHKILIDTGIGDFYPEKFRSLFAISGPINPLEKALNSINLQCADITDIVISHLHFDHIGGLGHLVEGRQLPLFPHAPLHLHREHFAYSQNPTKRDAGSFHTETFLPLLEHYIDNNLIHWLEGEKGEILSNLNFLISKGHTPFMVHPYDNKMLYLADICPTSNHIKDAWVMGYDMAPGVTVHNKAEILQFAAQNNLTLFFEHDPQFWGARISREEDKITLSEKLTTPQECAYPLTDFGQKIT
jgi:glyoxylase-like metal-dependent hydrolase (beta-lactamase superfamily II)